MDMAPAVKSGQENDDVEEDTKAVKTSADDRPGIAEPQLGGPRGGLCKC